MVTLGLEAAINSHSLINSALTLESTSKNTNSTMGFAYGKDHLTASKALQIARNQLKGIFDKETRVNVEQSYQSVVAIGNGEAAVYGINTGFGPLCNTIISKKNTGKLQENLLLSHSVGVGDPVSVEVAKLMLILKAHALCKGYSGISTEIVDRLLWHIDNDVIPVVPDQGSVGASGDLAPLSHLFLPLLGHGEVYVNGNRIPSLEALTQHGLNPITLHPKSGLALINGTQFIAAHAVQVVETLHSCLSHADLIATMMIEGIEGSASPFDPNLHKVRPHKGNLYVANRIHHLLTGSEMVEAHKDCDKVQDPYSLRCIPQVHGASRNAWLHLKEILEVEINAVTDNPIIINQDYTISGGNFHGQPLALPLDYACLAAAELGSISDRRSYLSLEGNRNCTPKLLVESTGLNSGFMILQYTTAALVSENKGLCFPASADSIPTSLGQEDHVSMGSIGARKALRVCHNLEKILAIELLCAAQALDFRRPLKSTTTIEKAHQMIRSRVPHVTDDRIFSVDINKAIDLVKERALLTLGDLQKIDEKHDLYSDFGVY